MNTVTLKIKRQDDPSDLPYWEEFEIEVKEGMTLLGALNAIGENPVTAEGVETKPVVCDSSCLESVCGACAMLINGRVALACNTLVTDLGSPVKIEPMEKFPITRDLKVDRAKMFETMAGASFFSQDDCAGGNNPPLRISPCDQQEYFIFSECIMCGACAEGCPQVNGRTEFPGAFMFARALAQNIHPIGVFEKAKRLDALAGRGGLSDCAGAKVCESVCPKGIPLSEAVARAGWSATANAIRKILR